MKKKKTTKIIIGIVSFIFLIFLILITIHLYQMKYFGGMCSFDGYWDTYDWGLMTLEQNGNNVQGTYSYNNGHIIGTVSGNVLSGKWSEGAELQHIGNYEFVLSDNCKEYNGNYNYEGKQGWYAPWDAKRTSKLSYWLFNKKKN